MPTLFPTRNDFFAAGRTAVVGTPNIRINPTMIDVPGSDLNLAVGVPSVMGEEVSARGALALRGAFVELARGAALDRVAYDRFGLQRFSATPATVDLVLTRPTPGGATPGTINAGAVVQTSNGTQMAIDATVTFGDFDTSKTCTATALVSGSIGNVVANTLVQWATAPFDTTIAVTNPNPAAGGLDQELDVQFLGRIRAFFPTVSRGTLGAIEYAAKQVPGVAVATATEITNPTTGYPAAMVQLVVGDSNGNWTTDMLTSVNNMLLRYRACGIFVQTIGGTVFQQTVAWTLSFQTGIDEGLAESRVRAVTVAVAQFLPPGPTKGTLLRSSLESAAKSVPGVIVTDSSLVYPDGDTVPTSVSQMIRVAPTDVTFV